MPVVDVTVVVFGNYLPLNADQFIAGQSFLTAAASAIRQTTRGTVFVVLSESSQPQIYPDRAQRAQELQTTARTVFGNQGRLFVTPSGSPKSRALSLYPQMFQEVAAASNGVAVLSDTPTRNASGETIAEACESTMQGLGQSPIVCILPAPPRIPDDLFDDVKIPSVRPGDTETVLDPAKQGGKSPASKGNMILLGVVALGTAYFLYQRRRSL
jgi:hypothetical protein